MHRNESDDIDDDDDDDDDDGNYNENNEQHQLPESFANSCCKIVLSILLQKLINNFAICTHCRGTLLVKSLGHGFGN